MPDYLASWPFWLVFAFLYLGATLRGQATYWLGRIVTEQTLRRVHPRTGWRRRVAQTLAGDGTQRGVAAIRRWGLVAIPFAYLTVGFQSMVLAAAGVLRVPWVPFTLAQLPGALAWAAIYSTVGFAVWNAAIAAAAGSPWGIATVVAIVGGVVGVVVVRRRRVRRAEAADDAPLPS
ncbi:DedA family protein [Georgenia faecalis]|uniref:DedA family protein n=1 Tax=Georgenia faecalis TaxID=2483799 RepID=UPI0013E0787F|nr:VTT domain-containing protein [Georgenia faecalis]